MRVNVTVTVPAVRPKAFLASVQTSWTKATHAGGVHDWLPCCAKPQTHEWPDQRLACRSNACSMHGASATRAAAGGGRGALCVWLCCAPALLHTLPEITDPHKHIARGGVVELVREVHRDGDATHDRRHLNSSPLTTAPASLHCHYWPVVRRLCLSLWVVPYCMLCDVITSQSLRPMTHRPADGTG